MHSYTRMSVKREPAYMHGYTIDHRNAIACLLLRSLSATSFLAAFCGLRTWGGRVADRPSRQYDLYIRTAVVMLLLAHYSTMASKCSSSNMGLWRWMRGPLQALKGPPEVRRVVGKIGASWNLSTQCYGAIEDFCSKIIWWSVGVHLIQ